MSAQTTPMLEGEASPEEGDRILGRDELELPRPGLLIVDDEPPILAAIRRTLRAEPYTIYTAESGKEGLRILEQQRIGVVISDYKMREMDGVQFLNIVRSRFPEIQRIMLTGQADQSAIQDVINQAQIFRFISKPWDPQALILTISASFDQYRVLRENERLWQITERQNRELRELNHSLEQRIHRRTAQLARAKVEWERTFDAIVDPVAIVSHRYEVIRANLSYAERGGVEIRDVPGKRCYEILAGKSAPCTGCPLARALLGEPPRGVDIETNAGRTLHVWAYPLKPAAEPSSDPGNAPVSPQDLASPLTEDITSNLPEMGVEPGQAAVCYYRDVTEERALAEELGRTQKLASLGLFVGGVAHEINNPIGGILAFTQLLLRQGLSDELSPVLKDIESSALRCKRIIESLLSFAQGSQQLRRSTVELGPLAEEAVTSFRRDYGKEDLEIRLDIQDSEVRSEADPALIHQLLRNLLQNAEHATSGPERRIDVRVLRIGAQAVLEVADRGHGIPEAHLSKIFDPFYTTKTDGRGTGLGLSICHRIAEQHGGSLEVRSKVGEGTTVRVLLPSVTAESQGEADVDGS
ncbi:MAG: ATP-binding protein [Myxococcota bacterium]